MEIDQVSRTPFRALTTNANTSSFASKIPTLTEPVNDGVLNLTAGGVAVTQRAKLWFIGVGADNDAFSVRLLGWHQVRGTGGPIWFPSVICELACVISAAVGIAASPVLNTERFADTITIVTEATITAATTRQGVVELTSPAADLIAHAKVWLEGFEKIEFQFDQTTNAPTMNALVSYL